MGVWNFFPPMSFDILSISRGFPAEGIQNVYYQLIVHVIASISLQSSQQSVFHLLQIHIFTSSVGLCCLHSIQVEPIGSGGEQMQSHCSILMNNQLSCFLLFDVIIDNAKA